MGSASLAGLYDFMVNNVEAYSFYHMDSNFYNFIWENLIKECTAWIARDSNLTSVCDGLVLEKFVLFIRHAWCKDYTVNHKELPALVCKTLLSINENESKKNVISKIKLLLIRVYFVRSVLDKKVYLVIPNDNASVYHLAKK